MVIGMNFIILLSGLKNKMERCEVYENTHYAADGQLNFTGILRLQRHVLHNRKGAEKMLLPKWKHAYF